MKRRLPLALALALVALAAASLAVAGCGEGEKDRFVDDYRPLNDRLLKLGRDLGKGLETADRKSNRALAEQFAGFALRLERINREIRGLDTPRDLKDESEALTSRIDAVVKSLKEISGAAGNGDPEAAATATVELGAASQALNRAQNKLAKATGAAVGAS